jgi:hypothetical protein
MPSPFTGVGRSSWYSVFVASCESLENLPDLLSVTSITCVTHRSGRELGMPIRATHAITPVLSANRKLSRNVRSLSGLPRQEKCAGRAGVVVGAVSIGSFELSC